MKDHSPKLQSEITMVDSNKILLWIGYFRQFAKINIPEKIRLLIINFCVSKIAKETITSPKHSKVAVDPQATSLISSPSKIANDMSDECTNECTDAKMIFSYNTIELFFCKDPSKYSGHSPKNDGENDSTIALHNFSFD